MKRDKEDEGDKEDKEVEIKKVEEVGSEEKFNKGLDWQPKAAQTKHRRLGLVMSRVCLFLDMWTESRDWLGLCSYRHLCVNQSGACSILTESCSEESRTCSVYCSLMSYCNCKYIQ